MISFSRECGHPNVKRPKTQQLVPKVTALGVTRELCAIFITWVAI